MTVIIIEDEEAARRGLRRILSQLMPQAQCLAELASIKESVDWFRRNTMPDLVFMDIQLKDGTSFDIFKEVSINTPIIFCTAYDQYAVEAFKANSIGYLLKPIDESAVKDCLDKLNQFRHHFTHEALKNLAGASQLSSGTEAADRFLVKVGKKLMHLEVDAIAYLHTQNRITYAVDFDGSKFPLDQSLEQLERRLPEANFFRINRQYIVNIKSIIEAVEDYGDYALKISPAPPESLFVSRYRFQAFKQWLGN